MRTGLPPLIPYVEGPTLPARPRSVVGFDGGLYLDRVRAGGEVPGGARQATAGAPVAEPLRLAVEVDVYVVPREECAVPVLHESPDGGVRTIDDPSGAHRGYEDRAPRTIPPASSPSAHALSAPRSPGAITKTQTERWSKSGLVPWRAKRGRNTNLMPGTAHVLTSPALRPLFLYVEGPSLPARLAIPLIVLGISFYLDRVSAGGKAPGGACQPAAGAPVAEPLRLAVEVDVYVVP